MSEQPKTTPGYAVDENLGALPTGALPAVVVMGVGVVETNGIQTVVIDGHFQGIYCVVPLDEDDISMIVECARLKREGLA